MAADAAHGNVDRINICQRIACHHANAARGETGTVMQGKNTVRLWKTRIEPVIQHLLGTTRPLLRRLGDDNQRAFPVAFLRHQLTGGTYQHRHVNIMTASVHDRLDIALPVLCGHGAGIGKAGRFLDGQAVHVGTDHQCWAGSILENTDDTPAANLFGDVEPGLAEFIRHFCGGLFLHEGEFRILMEMLVNRHKIASACCA
jgi:hypothetical protein